MPRRGATQVRMSPHPLAFGRPPCAGTTTPPRPTSSIEAATVPAGGPGRLSCRAIKDRERPAGQLEAVIERLDVEALAGDAEAIERVAQRRGVEFRGAFDDGIGW